MVLGLLSKGPHKGPRAKQLHSSPSQNAQALRSVPGGALGFCELNLELPANSESWSSSSHLWKEEL